MSDIPARAAALGYQPVPIHNGKFVRKGDSATVTYAPGDWLPNETTAIRTGLQASGLYLVRGDLDKHEDYQDPVARLADIKATCGNDLYSRLVIVRSSTRTGIDLLFLTPMLLKSGTPLADHDGYNAGEIKCEGGLGRANLPRDPADWIQGSLESIPVLTEAETTLFLSAFVLPVAPERPAAAPARTTQYASTGAMDWIKQNVDLIDYLGYPVARWYHNGGALVHCGCGNHKHGDRSASLSIVMSRAGHLVAFGKTPGCKFYTDSRGHDVINCMTICEGLSYADIAKKYGPPLALNTTSTVTPTSPVAPQRTIAAEPSKDALRKRTARQRQRDARRDTIRLAIETTPGVSKRARELALSLLSEDSLQSRTTNKQLQTRLGWSRPTVIRAFRDLEAMNLGKRTGGVSHVASDNGQWIAAVWNWFDQQRDTPKGVQSALSDTPIYSTNFDADPELACEEEVSSSDDLVTGGAPNIGRTGLAVVIRTYLNDIPKGKRASLKQAKMHAESYLPDMFTDEVIKDVYGRLMEQRRWDVATRDIPTMEWKALKREGARARGMAVKLSKLGENAAFFSALANEFDREVHARVNRGDAPAHYRRRKVGATQASMLPELIDEPPAPDISSSQAPPAIRTEIAPLETIRAIRSTYRRNLSLPSDVRREQAELARIAEEYAYV